MEHCPKISVIIPGYNCEKYVGEAIESVLNQSYENLSIVLVNDGSVDASAEICDRYATKYDRIHAIHQKNAGVSAARNAGIEYVLAESADTEYLAFLDADDKWVDGFFTDDIVSLFKQGYHLVGFQTARCNNALSRYRHPSKMQEGVFAGGQAAVWKNSKQTFGAAFYALSVIKAYSLRFPDKLKVNEDLIFSMQFKYLADTLYLCNRMIYLYRNNQLSASHRRVAAVDKYIPPIDAYLKSDDSMMQYQNAQRGILKEGHAMAAVYIVDMHEEHYQQFRAKREIDETMRIKPEYVELITSAFAYNRPDSGLRWQKMNAHPFLFRMKCYVRGIGLFVIQKVYRTLMRQPQIAEWLDKRRYPIEL